MTIFSPTSSEYSLSRFSLMCPKLLSNLHLQFLSPQLLLYNIPRLTTPSHSVLFPSNSLQAPCRFSSVSRLSYVMCYTSRNTVYVTKFNIFLEDITVVLKEFPNCYTLLPFVIPLSGILTLSQLLVGIVSSPKSQLFYG